MFTGKIYIKMLLILTIFFLLAGPLTSSMPLEYNILQHRYKLTSIDKSNIIKTNTYDNIWVQMIAMIKNLPCGFDKSSNFATRGMAIYKGELCIGTQNNFFFSIGIM